MFAHLDYRLVPAAGSVGLAVRTAWLDVSDERWLPAIEAAANRFSAQRQAQGRPVGWTAVEMVRVISHPVDTDLHAVEYNMLSSLRHRFDLHAEFQPDDLPSRQSE